MRPPSRCVIAQDILLLMASDGFARPVVTPASRSAHREQIIQVPAVEFNPRTVIAAFVGQADLAIGGDNIAPAETGPDVDVRPQTAAEEDAAMVPHLHRGQLLFVELEGSWDRTARRQLLQQVTATSQCDTRTLQAFNRAVASIPSSRWLR